MQHSYGNGSANLVLDSPFSTWAGWSLSIAAVPPGSYSVRVWQERWLPTVQTLQVPANDSLTVNVVTQK